MALFTFIEHVCDFKLLTSFSHCILIILFLVSVLLQVQIAEAKITHVIQLKHTLDLVPRLKVCIFFSKLFKSFWFHNNLIQLHHL